MDSIVEENGNSANVDESGHNLSSSTTTTSSHQNNSTNTNAAPRPPPAQQSAAPTSVAASVLSSTPNLQYHIPTAAHGLQMQSVIQAANQSSVIQTAATNSQPLIMQKSGGVLFVAKPNPATVIQTTSSNAVQIKPEPNTQSIDTNSEDSISDDESPRRRQDLTRRPSYHKILTEISGPDISAGPTLHMAESGGIPSIGSTGGNTPGTLIHLPQDSAPAFYLPNRIPFNTNNSVIAEDQTRKREIRLQKNREAARECRRKKKEYIKCLENRVAVLENQNKALIEELKSLKELYCQTKND